MTDSHYNDYSDSLYLISFWNLEVSQFYEADIYYNVIFYILFR
jgi:hypothetical protein